MSVLNNVVGYWAYIWETYIRGGGGAYIWNEVTLVHVGLWGLYSEVHGINITTYFLRDCRPSSLMRFCT
jgi:hypothetical protein